MLTHQSKRSWEASAVEGCEFKSCDQMSESVRDVLDDADVQREPKDAKGAHWLFTN